MSRPKLIHSLMYAVASIIGAANAAAAHAQWQASADVGLARLQQSGIPETTAPTFGLDLTGFADRSSLEARVLSARTSADRWTGQGLVVGDVHGTGIGSPRWALTGVASTFAASNEAGTVAGEALAQLRFGDASRGAALGIGGGGIAHDDRSTPLGEVDADVWTMLGANTVAVNASYVATHAVDFAEGSSAALPRLHYVDLSGRWQRDWSALSVGASGGVRSGVQHSAGAWASVDGTMWLTSRAAVIASLGRTLDDPERGVPATRFATVEIRLSSARRPRSLARAAVRGPAVTVAEESGGRRRITVRGVTGDHVELMADFTGWSAVPLERTGDAWVVDLAVSPGPHRLAMRVDGGEWTVPGNLPRVPDDLGGVVGLITIP